MLVSLGYIPLTLRTVSAQGPAASLELLGPASWFLRTLLGALAPPSCRATLRGSNAVTVLLDKLPAALRSRHPTWGVFADASCALLSDLLRAEEEAEPPQGPFSLDGAAAALCQAQAAAVDTAHDEAKFPATMHLVSCISSLCKRDESVSTYLEVHALVLLGRAAAAAHPNLRRLIEVTTAMITSAARMEEIKAELAARAQRA